MAAKKMLVARNRRQLPATSQTSVRKTDAEKMPDLSLFLKTFHADTQVLRKLPKCAKLPRCKVAPATISKGARGQKNRESCMISRGM